MADALDGVAQLNVAPSGSLLSIPFELLLSAPWAEAELARAPFLARRFAVSHVPSVGGFVNLRASARGVRAARP